MRIYVVRSLFLSDMNVYDFDGTIYRGDSSIDFYAFCLRKRPWLVVYLPYQLWMILLYKLGICNKEEEKSAYFSFLKSVPDVDIEVNLFWESHIKYIEPWYMKQKREDDVVISASPDFLLKSICSTLGVAHVIASQVEALTGRFLSRNCYGAEKVKRFYELFPDGRIENFYSDSTSDEPLANEANCAFLIENRKMKTW